MNPHPEAPELHIAPVTRTPVSTRLQGLSLILCRLGWAVVSLLVGVLLILSTPARFEQLRVLCTGAPCPVPPQVSPAGEQVLIQLGFSVDAFATYITVVHVFVALVYFAAGAIIFWRRSDDWLAIFESMALSLTGLIALPFLDALVATHPAWRVPVDLLRSVTLGVTILLWYIFPSGQFVSRWTRVLAVLLVVWTLIWPFTPLRYPSVGVRNFIPGLFG